MLQIQVTVLFHSVLKHELLHEPPSRKKLVFLCQLVFKLLEAYQNKFRKDEINAARTKTLFGNRITNFLKQVF